MPLLLILLTFLSGVSPAVESTMSPPLRAGTLHVLAFGLGAPMDGPPPDDLYGRDAGFMVEAFKRKPCAWATVDATLVSGLACTPKRLRSELARLRKVVTANDFVVIHASTHGTTHKSLLHLEGSVEVIDANTLAASLAALPCPSLVTIDACEAGGAVHSKLPPHSAWLLASTEQQSTDGQYDNQAVPHGFQVLALCEALRGDADADHDGLVTVGELCAWVPQRATGLARFASYQDSVVVLPPALAALPLTRAAPGIKQPLWTMQRVSSRNPWGLPDPPPLPQDAGPSAALVTAMTARKAVNKPWSGCDGIAKPAVKGSLGVWVSRWGATPAEQLENQGRAEIAETEHGFHAVIIDSSDSYIIEAVRDPSDPTRLSGRWSQLGSPDPAERWEGRIIDPRRIDGQYSDGAWDFRR